MLYGLGAAGAVALVADEFVTRYGPQRDRHLINQ
jgi:hypothetical protein